jgi:hypothetical protein
MKDLDYKAMEEKLEIFIGSPEGIAFLEKEQKKHELQLKRFVRFEEWLKHNDFDKLIQRLILEHDKKYREKCYNNGCEPYPNQKLSFLIDYIDHTLEPIRVPQLENMFGTTIWFFKGYYFRLMYGQGTAFDLYNGNDFKHLLSA